MIDDRIGTIGSTQGVNARPRPSRTKAGRMASSLPPPSTAAIPLSSDGCGPVTGAAGVPAMIAAGRLIAGAIDAGPGAAAELSATEVPIRRALASCGA